jgi:GDSL-like Lipase/Acylhydrolase family
MTHIVLLGDSIFDNGAYVEGGPDVISQLKSVLPAGWTATLLAIDGSITNDVLAQIPKIPETATHLIVSAGGNDGLAEAYVLQQPAGSVAAAIEKLAAIRAGFQLKYSRMLDSLLQCQKPLAVCTVYDPHFPDPHMQLLTTTALNLFNDCIIREAAIRGLPVLDLRLICTQPEDYANEIEPGVSGGQKIAAAILNLVQQHDFSRRRASLYTAGG